MSPAVPERPSLSIDGFEHRSAGPDGRSIHYVTAGSAGPPGAFEVAPRRVFDPPSCPGGSVILRGWS